MIYSYILNLPASVASETLPGVTQLKIGDVYWRASVASETVLGVDNAKSGICYICDRFWENRPKRGKQFFSVSPGKALWVDFFRKFFYGRNG